MWRAQTQQLHVKCVRLHRYSIPQTENVDFVLPFVFLTSSDLM